MLIDIASPCDELLARCRAVLEDAAEARRALQQARDDHRRLMDDNWRLCREYRAMAPAVQAVPLDALPRSSTPVPEMPAPAAPDRLIPAPTPVQAALVDRETCREILEHAPRFVSRGGPLGAAVALHAAIWEGIPPQDAAAYLIALVMEQVDDLPPRKLGRLVARARANLDAAILAGDQLDEAVAAILRG